MIPLLCFICLASLPAFASEEDSLGWTSAVIQCGKTQAAGDISCEIRTGEKGWEKFVIQAFGKPHALTESELTKLGGFPLASLRTTHEAGYEKLGGYTVHFRFDRTFYNADKKLVTEVIYISVNKKGLRVSEPRTTEH